MSLMEHNHEECPYIKKPSIHSVISVPSVAILYTMARLEDKVTVITGASSGIGRAIALVFAREGARVIVNYNKSKDQAQEVVSEIQGFPDRQLPYRRILPNPMPWAV